MADQSLERVGSGKSPLGCAEHMSDKQTRYSHVRIIENNNARVVLHWRYAISDILYNIFDSSGGMERGEWADEYYYIYPDGITTRYQILYSDHLSHEWQESIVINQPGTCPEDNIQTDAVSLADMNGMVKNYSWENGPPANFGEPEDAVIQMVNLSSEYKPFIIFEPGAGIKPFTGAIRPEISRFPWWNHWPVAQIPNDGRKAFAPDRPSHSSLSQSLEGSNVIHHDGEGKFWAVTLTGLSNLPVQSLSPLARSWNKPSKMKISSSNIRFMKYSKKQRAYILKYAPTAGKKISFTLNGSEKNPLFNPVIIIENMDHINSKVFINKKPAKPGLDYRHNYADYGNVNKLIIWFRIESFSKTDFLLNMSY